MIRNRTTVGIALMAAGLATFVASCTSAPEVPAEAVFLVPEDSHDWAPAWSPDGSRIAFNSGAGDEGDIYVMNADGSARTRLTFAPGEHERPRWSPDGTRLVFNSSRAGNADIYVMNPDGSDQTALTFDLADDARADWSPDGRRIVFDSERDGNREIYVMSADGSGRTRLTDHPSRDGYPSWSPDGTQIVFNSDRDGDGEIFVMNADGSDVRQLTHNEGALDQAPRWSPDGASIVFFSNRDNESRYQVNESEIYVVPAEGGQEARLTTARGWDFMPAWSPDGRFIAFDSQRDGRRAIYVMTANGFSQTKLTNQPVSDFIRLARDRGVPAAISAFDRYRAETDGDARPFYLAEAEVLAWQLIDGRRYDEGLALLSFNTELYPELPRVFVTLADAALSAGDKQRSLGALDVALRLTPGDSLTLLRMVGARAD